MKSSEEQAKRREVSSDDRRQSVDDRNVVPYVVAHASMWYCLRFVLTLLLRRLGPAVFRTATAERQNRSVLYLLSTINAAAATIFSMAESNTKPTIAKRHLLDCFIGYMLHDTVASIPQWRQYPSDVVHHVAVMSLCGYVRTRFHELFDITAPIMRLESSTIFLNAFWFVREYPSLRESAPTAVALLPLSFATSFFAVRVLWFPWYVYRLYAHQRDRFLSFGPSAHAGLAALMVMQFYWFTIIARKALAA